MNDDKYLIVPLQKHSDFVDISELKLLPTTNWQRRIKAQIHQSYGKAPYYQQLESIIDTFFTDVWGSESFAHFASEIIMHVSNTLELNCKWVFSNNLDVKKNKAEANIEIIKNSRWCC